MVIGVLQIELGVPWAESLKDKRSVVRSVKDRLSRRYRVSVAEVAELDNCRVARLGIVLAASDVKRCQSVLDRVLNALRRERDCVLQDQSTEILSGV